MTTLDLTCPDRGRHSECRDAAPGRAWTCPGCRAAFEVDARRQLRRIPVATVAVRPDSPWLTALLAFLDDLENKGRRMIAGIGHFLARGLWEWLGWQFLALGRVAVKAARVLAVFAAWAVLTFAPLALLGRSKPGLLLALAWMALALAGSTWGLLYVRRRPPRPVSPRPGRNAAATPAAPAAR
jgi:hypothetical protein